MRSQRLRKSDDAAQTALLADVVDVAATGAIALVKTSRSLVVDSALTRANFVCGNLGERAYHRNALRPLTLVFAAPVRGFGAFRRG